MVDKTYFAQVPEILWFSPNGKGRTYIWSCSVTNFMTRESRDALKNSNLDGHSNQTNKSDPRGRMCFHLVCVKSGCKCCQKVHFCKKMLGRETRAESVESGSSAAGKLRVIGLHWTYLHWAAKVQVANRICHQNISEKAVHWCYIKAIFLLRRVALAMDILTFGFDPPPHPDPFATIAKMQT